MDAITRAKFVVRSYRSRLGELAELSGVNIDELKDFNETPSLLEEADYTTINKLERFYYADKLNNDEIIKIATEVRDLLSTSPDSRVRGIAKKIESNPAIVSKLIFD